MVLALAVGGRWSEEAWTSVQLLAQARARSEPPLTRRRMEQAWRLRWYSVISCAAGRAFAASLLELRGGHGACGQVPPACEVEREQHHAGLCVKRNFVARVREVSVPGNSCRTWRKFARLPSALSPLVRVQTVWDTPCELSPITIRK